MSQYFQQIIEENDYLYKNLLEQSQIKENETQLQIGNWISLREFLIQNNLDSKPVPVSILISIMMWCLSSVEKIHREGIVHLGIDLECFSLNVVDQDVISTSSDSLNVSNQIVNARLIHFFYSQTINSRNAHILASDTYLPHDINLLSYASPEMIQNRKSDYIDFRSDIYSLGVVFYRLASGHDLFYSTTMEEIKDAHCFSEIIPITSHVQNFPLSIQYIIMTMLQKPLTSRFLSIKTIIQLMNKIKEDLNLDIQNIIEIIPNTPTVYNKLEAPVMLLPSENHFVNVHVRNVERLYLQVRNKSPVSILLSGNGRKEIFNTFSGHYRSSCIFASSSIKEGMVAHRPVASIAQQITYQLFKLPEDEFLDICEQIRSKFRFSYHTLISLIPEMFNIFYKNENKNYLSKNFNSSISDPEISDAIINTLISYLEIFCSNGRHLCVYIDHIHQAGNYFWRVLDQLLTKKHCFMLIGGSGSTKEEINQLKSVQRRLKKLGIQTNNYNIESPKSSTLRAMIQATLDGVPGVFEDIPNNSQESNYKLTNSSFNSQFQKFSDAVILKSGNDLFFVGEILQFLRASNLITISSTNDKMWIPKWIEASTTISSLKNDVVSRNISRLSPHMKQILEIATVMDIPFTLNSMCNITKRDLIPLFIDIHQALRDGWLIRNGPTFQISNEIYLKSISSNIDQSTLYYYLKEIIFDSLKEIKENNQFKSTERIYDILNWMQQLFEMSKLFGQNSIEEIYKIFINDFVILTTIACRRLLMTNLPKTANNFMARALEVLKASTNLVEKHIQFELEIIYCYIMFNMGHFTRAHHSCIQQIEQINNGDIKSLLKILPLVIVNGISCGEYSKVLDLFFNNFKYLNGIESIFGTQSIDNINISKGIIYLLRKIEKIILLFDSIESIFNYFDQDSPIEDDIAICIRVVIESELILHEFHDHYIFFGLLGLSYILDSRKNSPYNTIIFSYGLYALKAISCNDIYNTQFILNDNCFNTILRYLIESSNHEICIPMRYSVKRERILVSLQSDLSFGEQFTKLQEIKKISMECKEPILITSLQSSIVSILSGIHINDILTNETSFELHSNSNNEFSLDLIFIYNLIRTYADSLSDKVHTLKKPQIKYGSNNTNLIEMKSKFFDRNTKSIIDYRKTDNSFQSINDIIEVRVESKLGQFFQSFLLSLYFMHMNDFEEALHNIQNVINLRNSISGNVVFDVLPFFIVNICYQYLESFTYQNSFSREEMENKAIAMEIISNELRNSENQSSEIAKCINYFCDAISMTYKDSIDYLKFIQLLQKSIQIAHNLQFHYMIGIISEILVTTFKKLDFSDTIIESTLHDALQAWSLMGASKRLNNINNRFPEIIQKMSSKNSFPIVFLHSEAISNSLEMRKDINNLFLDILTSQGINLEYQKDPIKLKMIVVIFSIQEYEKLINPNSSIELIELVSEYLKKAKVILQKYMAFYEINLNGRITAYFSLEIMNAHLAVLEIQNEVKLLQQGKLSNLNSTSFRICASLAEANVIISQPLNWNNEQGRLDSNFSPIYCLNIEEILWQDSIASKFNIPIVISEDIYLHLNKKFITTEIKFLYLGKFQQEKVNSEILASIYELYSQEWGNESINHDFGEGLSLFQIKKFLAASNIFTRIAKGTQFSDTVLGRLSKFYIEACRLYKQIQLAEEWNGVIQINQQFIPLPIRNQGTTYYLQRGIRNSIRENDENSSLDSQMLQQQLDQKQVLVNQMNDSLTQKEDIITDQNFQIHQIEADKKALKNEVNKLLSLLSKEKKNRSKIERKYLALKNCNGALIGGKISVPAKLLFFASPAKDKSLKKKVHPIIVNHENK